MNLKNTLLLLSFVLGGLFVQRGLAQCPTIEFIMANACDDASNAESDAEFMILNSGSGFNVDDLTVDFDTNNNGSGPTNLDIGPTSGCGFMYPFGAQLQVFGNPPPCPNVTLVGPGDAVPANVLVVIFTSSAMTGDTYDWSALCGAGQPVYLMQSDCDRTIGAFTDGTGSSSPRTTIISIPGPPACNDVLTYDRMNLVGGDGGWVMDDGAGGLTYGNGCAPPPIPLPCTPPNFNNPGDQTECGSYTLPVITGSSLTGNEIYSDMPNGAGTVYAAGDAITATTTIYIFDPTEPCENPSFTVTINPLPVANTPASEMLICYSLPATLVSDNIAAIENEITGGVGGLTVNWYTNAAGTTAINFNNAVEVIALLPSPFVVYATVTDGVPCESTTVPVTVNLEIAPNAAPASDQVCDDGSGMHIFDLTDYEATINGGSGAAVTYYSDAAGNNMIADPTMFSVTAPSGTAYAAVASANGCLSSPEAITLTINPSPDLSMIDFSVAPQSFCGSTNVDLTFTIPVSGTFNVTVDATGGVVQTDNYVVMDGDVVTFSTTVTATTTFTITAASGTDCPGTGTPNAVHVVTILPPPALNLIGNNTICEGQSIDLSTLVEDANATGYPITFHTGSPANAGNQLGGPVVSPNISTSYYALIDDGTGVCQSEIEIPVVVNPAPSLSLIGNNTICEGESIDLTSLVEDANNTGYPITIHSATPTSPGNQLGNTTVMPNASTDYYAAIEDPSGSCQDEITINVVVNPAPDLNLIGNNTICVGGSVDLTSLVEDSNNTGYPITFHSGTPANAGNELGSTSVMPNVNTSYYALIEDVAGICQQEIEIPVVVNPAPNLELMGNNMICEGASIDLTSLVTDSNNTGYPITFHSGTPANAGNELASSSVMPNTTTDYYALIEDPSGSCQDEIMITVTVSPAPLLNLIGNNIICSGQNIDLSSLVEDANNTGYAITFHSGTPANSGNELGSSIVMPTVNTSYYALIEDMNAVCQAELEIPVVVDPLPLALDNNIDACGNELNEGIFNLTALDGEVNGGTGFPVHWYFDYIDESNNIPIPNPTNLQITSTIVYAVVDNGACFSLPAEIDLNVLPFFSIEIIEGTAIQCFGGSDANLVTNLTNGVPNFSYDWSDDNFDGTANPIGVGVGTYSVTVTDANMCSAVNMITIDQPEELMISCGEQTGVTVVDGDDGVAFVTITGGTPDYTIAWSGVEMGSMVEVTTGTYLITDLMAGDYNILVTDGHGCTKTCSFTITDPNCLMTLDITGTNPLCNGDTNGSIDLTVTNAVTPFTYDWNIDALDGIEDPTMLGANTYVVTVTDGDGCSSTKSIVLTAPAELTLDCNQPVNPNTVGGTDGQMTIVFGGGTANYMVSWTGPVSGAQLEPTPGTLTIEDLSAGTYDVHIEDANGCTADCNFTLTDPGCTVALTSNVTAVFCFGESDGAISLSTTGGNAPFDYNWDNDAYDGMASLVNLPAGIYDVTVTDASQCTVSESIEVTQPTPLTINCGEGSQVTTVGGNDGVANITIGGGTAPYTLSWSGAASGTQAEATAGMVTINMLIAGDYTITLTDANNCSQTCDFTITEVTPGCNMTLSITNTPNNCFGESQGSIDLTITNAIGATNIDWDDDTLDGIEDPGGLTAGTYSVTVTDENNCVAMITTTLVDPEELTLSCAQSMQASAPGASDGAATLTIAGGSTPYAINWTGTASGTQTANNAGMAIVSGLASGNYMVTVTDANNCTTTCNFNITEVGCMLEVNVIPTQVNCPEGADGSILLEINGGADPVMIDWSDDALDGEINPTGLSAGDYMVTVIDANDCMISNTITLTTLNENPILTVDAPNAVCNNGCIAIDLSFEGTPPFLAQGTIVELGLSIALPVFSTDTTIMMCPELFGIMNGTFTLAITEVSDANCSQLLDISSVIQIESPSTFTLVETLCPGEAVVVNGQTYDMDSPTGVETLSGAAANGCDSIVTINLDYLPAVTASLKDDVAICNGEAATLIFEISDGGLYDVTFSDGVNLPIIYPNVNNGFTVTVNPTQTTDYFITEVTAVGQDCPVLIDQDKVTVSVSQLEANAAVETEISCGGANGGTVRVFDNGGIPPMTYLWSTGDENDQVFGLEAGTYTVTVEDAVGCIAEAEVTLAPSEVFEITVSAKDANCLYEASGVITIEEVLGGSGNLEYSLDGEFFEPIGSLPLILPQQVAGVYTVYVQDDNACLAEAEVTINAAEELLLELGDNDIIDLGDSIQLEGIVNFTPAEIHWSPTETLSDPNSLITYAKPQISTTYTLLVLDEAGCSAQNFIQILVNQKAPIFIPNAFSPNGDGVNDILYINAKAGSVKEVRSFYIYDRWGEMVFTAEHFLPNNPDYGWDGLLDGRPLNPAVFIYAAEVEFVNGQVEIFSGDVVLVK